jgi:hypothetical protein
VTVRDNGRPLRPYHWAAMIPTIGLLAGIPFANRVDAYVLGLPLLLFWIVAWVVATSGVMGIIWMLDRRRA